MVCACVCDADMGMEDPVPTFSYLVEQIKARFPDLAYLHPIAPSAPLGRAPADASVRTPAHPHLALEVHVC